MTDLTEVKGIGPATAVKLHSAGIKSAEQLARAEVDHIIGAGIGRATARKIITNAKDIVDLSETELAEPLDIEGLEPVEDKPSTMTDISGIGPKTKKDLELAGYLSIEDLAKATVEDLQEVEGIGPATAQKIIDDVRDSIGKVEVEEPSKEEKPEEPTPQKAKKEIPKAKPEPKTITPVEEEDEEEDEGEEIRTEHERSPASHGIPTKKKKGVQIKSASEEEKDFEFGQAEDQEAGWEVKTKELTEEEKEARRRRQEQMAMANRITREIPKPPEPVKAEKTEVKEKSEKPVKKKKEKKKAKKAKVKKEVTPEVEYFSNKDIYPVKETARKRGIKAKSSDESEPRIELERDTYLGKITSHRRSRRVIHERQVIVKLDNGYEPEKLVGKKVYFTYPTTGKKVSGSISKRFGKSSSGKVLVNFKKGITPEGILQKVYIY